MQNKLDEILKQITGSSQTQSSTDISIPKKTAFEALDAFDVLAQQNAKQSISKRIWNFIKWNVKTNIIPKKTDAEIRTDLKKIYDVLDPFFKKLETGYELQEYRELNDPKVQKFVENIPTNQEIMELVEEVPVITEKHGEL